jgi:hypothetical protein
LNLLETSHQKLTERNVCKTGDKPGKYESKESLASHATIKDCKAKALLVTNKKDHYIIKILTH